jgi:hypothetical protein
MMAMVGIRRRVEQLTRGFSTIRNRAKEGLRNG